MQEKPIKTKFLMLILLLLTTISIALMIGRYPKLGFIGIKTLFVDPLAMRIVLDLRLPRIIAAVICGAVLSGSGFVFQMVFTNPLVEPGFLGVSQGAAFGAALAIVVFGYSTLLVQTSAAIFSLLGLYGTFLLANKFHFGGWILRLILSGIAISALFSSGLGMIKYIADPTSELQELTFWLLGGLWSVSWYQVISILPFCLLSLLIMYLYRWRVNLLSMNDRTSFSVGVSPKLEKSLLLIGATVGTAASISISGLVGWIGLIVPHIARKLFGSNSKNSLPAAMIMGAIYLLICDTIGRSLFAGELPLGILTSLSGALLFILFLTSKQSLGETL